MYSIDFLGGEKFMKSYKCVLKIFYHNFTRHLGITSLCTVVAGVLLLLSNASAQPGQRSGMAVHGGDIIGTIESCSASLAGVEVYIPGHSFQAKTTQDGKFKLHYVQPGSYTLVVTRNGQVRTSLQNIVVVKNILQDRKTARDRYLNYTVFLSDNYLLLMTYVCGLPQSLDVTIK